jgi:hypothetical protein
VIESPAGSVVQILGELMEACARMGAMVEVGDMENVGCPEVELVDV